MVPKSYKTSLILLIRLEAAERHLRLDKCSWHLELKQMSQLSGHIISSEYIGLLLVSIFMTL